MIYQDLHWESINFLKRHLYYRLTNPLNNALGRLAIAQHMDTPARIQEQIRYVEQSLALTLNLVKAWAVLIHVQSGGVINDHQRRQITPGTLPGWLLTELRTYADVRIEQTQALWVQPETFYESLILTCLITKSVGTLKHLVFSDSKGVHDGVWVRAVFVPPYPNSYASLNGIMSGLDLDNDVQRETIIQLKVLAGFLKINKARFTLQNNTQTGEQSLAALVPLAPADASHVAITEGSVYAQVNDQVQDDETPEKRQVMLYKLLAAEEGEPAAEDPLTGPVPTPTLHAVPAQPQAADSSHTLDVEAEALALDPSPEEAADAATPGDAPVTGAAAAAPADEAAPDSPTPTGPENEAETLIVPPPNFRKRLLTTEPPANVASLSKPPSASPKDASNNGDSPNATTQEESAHSE